MLDVEKIKVERRANLVKLPDFKQINTYLTNFAIVGL
jgi:hypothetical protein